MNASAKVPRDEWLAALKPFLKTKPPKKNESGDVMLTVEDGLLTFRYGGMETRAAAEGQWLGAATVEWGYVFRIAKIPPLKDPVSITVDGALLKVEGSAGPCRWLPAGGSATPVFANEPSPPDGTKDKTFSTLVSMSIDYTDEKIASLGLTAQVRRAKREKERLIQEAARVLAPLEITSEDLKLLVLKTLGRKTKL